MSDTPPPLEFELVEEEEEEEEGLCSVATPEMWMKLWSRETPTKDPPVTLREVVAFVRSFPKDAHDERMQPVLNALDKMMSLLPNASVVDMSTYEELLALASTDIFDSPWWPGVGGFDYRHHMAAQTALLETICAAAGVQPTFGHRYIPNRPPTPGVSATRFLWDLLRTGAFDNSKRSDDWRDTLWRILAFTTLDPPTAFEECGCDAATMSAALVRLLLKHIDDDCAWRHSTLPEASMSSTLRNIIVSCCGTRLLEVFGVDVTKIKCDAWVPKPSFVFVPWFDIRELLPLAQNVLWSEVTFVELGSSWRRRKDLKERHVCTTVPDTPQWNAEALCRNSEVHKLGHYAFYSEIAWLPALFPDVTIAPFPRGRASIEYDPKKVDNVTARVFDVVNRATTK